MKEIKAGQIYEDSLSSEIFVITFSVYGEHTCIIEQSGFTRYNFEVHDDCKLLAEYPTWQEAVNSKEFRQ